MQYVVISSHSFEKGKEIYQRGHDEAESSKSKGHKVSSLAVGVNNILANRPVYTQDTYPSNRSFCTVAWGYGSSAKP
jgi:hypothetical protein